MVKLLLTIICVLCLLGVFSAAQAESVRVSEGWFATISNFSGDYYCPDFDSENNNFHWDYFTWNGFQIYPEMYLLTTTSLLRPIYTQCDEWNDSSQAVMISIDEGWIDTLSDRVTVYPVMFVGDEWWYHVSFDWSTSCEASPAARYLTWELWAGTGTGWDIAWSVTPGAGYHEGHVDMDVPLTYIGAPEFALSFQPVPEPSSVLALLCGLGSVVVLARRSRSTCLG